MRSGSHLDDRNLGQSLQQLGDHLNPLDGWLLHRLVDVVRLDLEHLADELPNLNLQDFDNLLLNLNVGNLG